MPAQTPLQLRENNRDKCRKIEERESQEEKRIFKTEIQIHTLEKEGKVFLPQETDGVLRQVVGPSYSQQESGIQVRCHQIF